MRLILGFLLPLLCGNLFQQFYNLMDTIIVGRTLGVSALAGVGATGSINFLIVGFCIGICSGFSIPVSQAFGAENYSEMRKMTAHACYLTVLFMFLMTVGACIFTGTILRLTNTPQDIFDYSYRYIFIIFLGIPCVMFYNLAAGIIRALGNSRIPVLFLIIASIVNIVLDLLFILAFGLGVSGAALATDLSQGLAALLCFVYIRARIPLLKILPGEWKPSGRLFKILFSMGVPMGLQYSVTAIGSVILQSAVNSLGSVMVASMTAAQKVGGFFCCPFDALGATMATYAGQNVGAKKLERLNQGLLAGAAAGASYAVAALIVLLFIRSRLVMLFLDTYNAEVVSCAGTFLLFNACFYIPLMLVNEVRFMIQGMGYPGLAIIAGICEMVGRTACALILIPRFGWIGACLASPIAWVIADSFLLPAYFAMRRKTYRILGEDPGRGPGSFHS